MTDKENEEKKKDLHPSVVPPIAPPKPPESSRDPLMLIVEIVENKNISLQDKTSLIEYARRRFRNRTRIAYIALFSIVVSLALLFIAAFIDGMSAPGQVDQAAGQAKQTFKGILATINNNEGLFAWIEGFLAAIVGAYYGVTAWRPSS